VNEDLEVCPRCRWVRSLCECPREQSYLDTLRAALVDTTGLDRLPEPVSVVHGALYVDSLAWLQGKPGHGKSFVALDVAGCVATGETWHGRPTKQGPVLYLIAEGAAGLRSRVRAWEHAMGHPMTGVLFLPVAVQSSNAGAWGALVDLVAELRPVLVVVDTQARVTVGRDENSAQDMGEFVDRLEQLRRAASCCVLVVHHEGRNGEHMRGSTALLGAATTVIRIERNEELLTVSCVKQKDAPEFDRFTLRMVPMEQSVVLSLDDGRGEANAVEACARSLARWREIFAEEWVSLSQLVKADVIAERTFYRYRLQLISAGLVEKTGDKSATRYRLVRHV